MARDFLQADAAVDTARLKCRIESIRFRPRHEPHRVQVFRRAARKAVDTRARHYGHGICFILCAAGKGASRSKTGGPFSLPFIRT